MRFRIRRRRDERAVAVFDGAFQARFGRTLSSLGPTELPAEVVTDGGVHEHRMEQVPWDGVRLGPSMCDVDEEEMAKPGVAFPFATFKTLYRCSCGHEIVRATRSLL